MLLGRFGDAVAVALEGWTERERADDGDAVSGTYGGCVACWGREGAAPGGQDCLDGRYGGVAAVRESWRWGEEWEGGCGRCGGRLDRRALVVHFGEILSGMLA